MTSSFLQVLNLSRRRRDLTQLSSRLYEFGWPASLAPSLERLCSICKSIDAWLASDARNVVVLHCRGGRDRLAVVIAAYMNYTSICARCSPVHCSWHFPVADFHSSSPPILFQCRFSIRPICYETILR